MIQVSRGFLFTEIAPLLIGDNQVKYIHRDIRVYP